MLGFQLLGALGGHSLGLFTHLGFEQFVGTAGPRTLAEDALYVFGEDDLALHQQLCQLGVAFLVLGQNLFGTLILLAHHLQHLVVDDFGRRLRIGTLELILRIIIIAQVGQTVAHAGIGYHAVGLLGGALQVVHGACRDMSHEEFLGSTAAEQRAHLVEHGLLGLQHTLFGQIPGGTESLASGHDGDLHQRVGKLGEPRDGGVACLVDGYGALLGLGHHLRLLLQTADDAVDGIEEVLLTHGLTVVAGGYQGCLVAYIGDVGTGEAGCLAGQEVYVDGVVQFQRFQVDHKHLLTLVQVRQVDVYLAVKAACTQQGRVEHVYTVGGGQDDDTAVGAEAVHLSQQGVQRVLAFVVAAHGGVLRAGTAHGIDLVDEDDARTLGLGLLEQVAYTAGTHTDKHLDEVGT